MVVVKIAPGHRSQSRLFFISARVLSSAGWSRTVGNYRETSTTVGTGRKHRGNVLGISSCVRARAYIYLGRIYTGGRVGWRAERYRKVFHAYVSSDNITTYARYVHIYSSSRTAERKPVEYASLTTYARIVRPSDRTP